MSIYDDMAADHSEDTRAINRNMVLVAAIDDYLKNPPARVRDAVLRELGLARTELMIDRKAREAAWE